MLEGEKLRAALRGELDESSSEVSCVICDQPIEGSHTHAVFAFEQDDGSFKQYQHCVHRVCALMIALGFIPTPDEDKASG